MTDNTGNARNGYIYNYKITKNDNIEEMVMKCYSYKNGKLINKNGYTNISDGDKINQYFYNTIKINNDNNYTIRGKSLNQNDWEVTETILNNERKYKLDYDKNKFLTFYPKRKLRRSERLMKKTKSKTKGFHDPLIKELELMYKKYYNNSEINMNLYDYMY